MVAPASNAPAAPPATPLATPTAASPASSASPSAPAPPASPTARLAAAWRGLARPVDAASFVAFRTVFGLLLGGEVLLDLITRATFALYARPAFHPSYPGFAWVPRPDAAGLLALHGALAAACFVLAAGIRPRLCAALVAVLHTWHFLLDASLYLNHAYLISLIALLLAALPSPRDGRVPAWVPAALAFQMAVVYGFGGLAKLNADWLHGWPLRSWLGPKLDVANPWGWPSGDTQALVMAWVGCLFDLTIPLWLTWRRTRAHAFAAAAGFHVINARIFEIGVFPWLAIALTTLWFPPDWPRRFVRLLPSAGLRARLDPAAPPAAPTPAPRAVPRWLVAYALVQLLLPLRHVVLPGDVAWNEAGHRFAWRMKLRSKVATGLLEVAPRHGGPHRWVRPAEYLTRWQETDVLSRPDLLADLARAVSADHDGAAVFGHVHASLNGRPPRPLVDPAVDLTADPPVLLGVERFVLPLEPGLPPGLESSRLAREVASAVAASAARAVARGAPGERPAPEPEFPGDLGGENP